MGDKQGAKEINFVAELRSHDGVKGQTQEPDSAISVDLSRLSTKERNLFSSLMASAGITYDFGLGMKKQQVEISKRRMSEHYLVTEIYCDFCGHMESDIFAMIWNDELKCLIHERRTRRDIQENPMNVETKRYHTNNCDCCYTRLNEMTKYQLIELVSDLMFKTRRMSK